MYFYNVKVKGMTPRVITIKTTTMKNHARNIDNQIEYTVYYNKSRRTIRVAMGGSNKTIVTIHNPTAEEVEYFIYDTPTALDVKSHFLR